MTQQTNPKRRFLRLRSAARAAGRTYDRTVSWPALEVMTLNYGFRSAATAPTPRRSRRKTNLERAERQETGD